jgi:hypothetical protein
MAAEGGSMGAYAFRESKEMSMKFVKNILIMMMAAFIAGGTPAAGQEDLFPGGSYDASVPQPEEFIGHRFGEKHTFTWEMERYLKALDQASSRVKVERYGRTYQGRYLYTVFVSSPGNLDALEKIRLANLELTDPRKTSLTRAQAIADWMPSLVWLGYNIHGNEASGMEAAIRTLYQLAAGTDETTKMILDEIVCIVDPCQNPDGHDRFVHQVRSVATIDSHPDPRDVEHDSGWPGGRSNHYMFDLNRDFFLKTQIESLQKARVYHRWMPHVFADLHEMGSDSTYFFSPPMTPYNQFVKPMLMKWWNIIAEANAAAFDRFGWGYYTRESFDAFYPGYGTSYPSINGAVGMTYEQASARGVSIRREDGTVLTLTEAARHHFTTSMATLTVTAERRKEKIMDFYDFFVTGMEEAETEPVKEIIWTSRNDPQIAAQLVENCLIEGVEVVQAEQAFTNTEAVSYLTGKVSSVTFPKGSYVVVMNQPQKILINTLLAPESPLSPDFIQAEKERQAKGERGHFYDVTAWSLPLAYGVDAYWTRKPSRYEGKRITEKPDFSGELINRSSNKIYLIPYSALAGSRMLVSLWKEGFRVRMAVNPFSIDGREWPAGTLVVRANRNSTSLHERIPVLAREIGVEVTAVGHELTEDGIDLGSNNVVHLEKPRIALLTHSPVSSYSYGAVHYLFERCFHLDFIRLSTEDFRNLDEFNVLVIPDGRYGEVFGETEIEELRNWVQEGGTVVAVSGAAEWLRQAGLARIERIEEAPDPEDPEKMLRPKYTPGAMAKVHIHPDSFLGFGVRKDLAVQVRSTSLFGPYEDNPRKNVGRYADLEELRISGFMWPETEKLLAGKIYLAAESLGRGNLIMFMEDPNYRAAFPGLHKLFLNCVVLGPSFDVR